MSPLFHESLGGVGRQAVLLAAKLSEYGLSFFVLSRKMKNLPELKAPLNVEVYYVSAFRPGIHILEEKSFVNLLISFSFSIMLALKLFSMRKKYDIVHFQGASLPLIVCLPLLKLLRKKVIAKVLASGLGTEAGSLRGKYLFVGNLLAYVLRKTDAFVAISQEIADGLKNDGVETKKIIKISNFVDTEKFYPVKSEVKHRIKAALALDESIVINFTGRIVERKGLDFLINAFAQTKELLSSSILIIVGAGTDESKMKNLVSKLGIDNNIRFLGHASEIVRFYKASDIFVLPSFAEGMPNSLLEAMACGLPIIASKIGGVVDVVQDERSGILFESGDMSGLSSAMVRLAKDDALRQRLGAEARKRILEDFSVEGIVDKYIKLYKTVLAQ